MKKLSTSSHILQNQRIATKIALMVLPLLLIALAAIGLILWNSYTHFDRASTLQEANRVSDFVLRAAGEQAKERGFTATALANPDDAGTRAKIPPLRTKGDLYADSAWNLAQTLVLKQGIGQNEASKVAKARMKRDAFRTRVDAVLGKETVSQQEITEWVGAQTALILAEKNLANALFSSNNRIETILALNTQIKSGVLNASEYAGRERATLGVVVGSKKPIPRETLAMLMRYRGIVEEGIAVIADFANHPRATPAIKEAISSMQSVLRADYETSRSLIYNASSDALQRSEESVQYPITTGQWIERSTKGINAMLAVSDAVSGEVRGIAEEEYRTSMQTVILVFCAVVVIALVAILAWFIQRSIRERLLILQQNAKSLEIGRFDEKIDSSGADEIAQVSASFAVVVDTLRNFTATQQSLINAALDGNMNARADSSGYSGGFKSMVEGTNNALAAAVKPIEESLQSLQAMANGDFTQQMKGHYLGDHALLKESLNSTLEALNSAMHEVNHTANFLLQSARQVAEASQSLSSGNVEQAASLEQITSSVHQIASQITHTASSAGVAVGLAEKSQSQAKEGNEDMLYLNETVQAINDSSSSIAGIVKAIDDIAFQTNMLALNAAIEAARAGRFGRGFAVVAEEVRALARRSAEAAQKTTSLIENAVANAAGSFAQTQITSERFQTIVSHATDTAVLVREINEHTSQQASGINQITLGLSQIDKVVQITAANAEESAAAAQELESHAQKLHHILGRFLLQDTGNHQALQAQWHEQ